MFNTEELERAIRQSKERETIRVTYADGKVLEHEAGIWTVVGLDRESGSEITWGKICIVGGDDVVADAVLHMAQLAKVAKDIGNSLIKTVPGLTEKKLGKVLSHAIKVLEERHEEVEGNA